MTDQSLINSNLCIRDFELRLHLGWPDNERLKEQLVLIEIDIWFDQPPKACITDKLEDTFCYSNLINHIKEKIAHRHFHLIEHLGCEIHKVIKELLSDKNRVLVRITKHPKIPGLKGGVTFTYWDRMS